MKLHDEHLLPRSQDLTELYFTDYRTLPKSLKAGAVHTLKFTVHNLENKDTTYKYSVVATAEDTTKVQKIGAGTITLTSTQTQAVSKNITVPSIGERIMIKVNLEYQGVAFGEDTSSPQTQGIHYWIQVDGLPRVKGQS